MHGKGIVHRDIRIPNVLIDGENVFLIDFGLARWADGERYRYDTDYSYLGDFLLYLLYSSYEPKSRPAKGPWYEELSLDGRQKSFIKKLFGMEPPYKGMDQIKEDFIAAFGSR